MKPNRIIVFIAIAATALSLFCIPCHAQDKCDKPFEIDLPAEGKDVMLVCEQQPEFPGGMRALMDYLKKEIRYPKKCSASGIEGRAFVRFIVDKNGKIKKVELFKSSGNQLLDKEAIRVVKKMPRWNPGKNKGEAVNVMFTLPVNFKLYMYRRAKKNDEMVFSNPESQPEFPGGWNAVKEYLQMNIRYPKECVENRNEGKAFVRFIVEKNGKIKKVELARSSGNSLLDKEAIRVVKKMPRWNPGTIYNKPERMAVTMPVEFRLDTIDKVVECPIVGVWQQCVVKQNAAGKLDVNVGAAIKVYDNDNTYYSLFPYRNNISGFVVQKGCYDIVDDNTFHEKILSHFNKPWEGTVSVMNYEFIDEEKMIMKIVYTNTSNNFTDTEFWLRIKPLE